MHKVVFSSDELPAHLDNAARFRLWRDIYGARYGEADFTYEGDRPFRAHCEFALLGQVGIAKMDMTLHQAVRTSRHVAADGRYDLLFSFNRSGRQLCLTQRGREMVSQPGDGWSGVFTNADPLVADHQGESRFTGICVPLASLLPRLPHVEGLLATQRPMTPAARHLGRYLDFLMEENDIEFGAALTGQLETTLIDLLVLGLGGSGDEAAIASARGLRAARGREIIAMIHARYADPAFSPHEIDRGLGLSQRYVQELLQESGASFTERVLELRLQKVRAMLSDARNDRLKIGELAFACGFGDVSYFNQAFRRKFGAAPSHFRGGDNGG